MRIFGFLLAAATVLAAACTATTSPDAQCIAAGGLCFISSDTVMNACGSPMEAPCSVGYTCCSEINASNVKNGMAFDAAPFVLPVDATADALDGATDALDAAKTDASDAAKTDAKTDASDAAKSDAPTDAAKSDATRDASDAAKS